MGSDDPSVVVAIQAAINGNLHLLKSKSPITVAIT
jgi:hypothetical protein